jgi:hypothetical protein
MGNDIEAVHTRFSEDNGSLKAPTAVGRQELADIIPPHDSYEGKHRFDPTASWTIEEERRVVWKTDLKLLPWLCLMMFGLQVSFTRSWFDASVSQM